MDRAAGPAARLRAQRGSLPGRRGCSGCSSAGRRRLSGRQGCSRRAAAEEERDEWGAVGRGGAGGCGWGMLRQRQSLLGGCPRNVELLGASRDGWRGAEGCGQGVRGLLQPLAGVLCLAGGGREGQGGGGFREGWTCGGQMPTDHVTR